MASISASVDLLKLPKVGVKEINGYQCLVIPITLSGINLKVDDNLNPVSANLYLNINERRNVGNYGQTHFVKQGFSKEFRESNKELVEQCKQVYLGDGRVVDFNNGQQNAQTNASPAQQKPKDDGLPF